MADPRAAFKFRPRELFFMLVGVTGCAGAAVFWFQALPEMMVQRGVDPTTLVGLGALVITRAFQVAAIAATVITLAAGSATRTSTGKDRATWILAAGATIIVVALVLSVLGLQEAVLAPPPAVDGGS